MAKKVKATVKTNVTPKAKFKAIKPKMGQGTGGILPVYLKLKVEKDKKDKKNKNGCKSLWSLV